MQPWIDFFSPTQHLARANAAQTLALHSHLVIGLRLAGIMGWTGRTPDTLEDMIQEKQDAILESTNALVQSAFKQSTPIETWHAMTLPFSTRANANLLRLINEQE